MAPPGPAIVAPRLVGGDLLPVFRVANGVLFPGTMAPFYVRHPASRAAVDEARAATLNPYRGPSSRPLLFVVVVKRPSVAETAEANLHPVGCVAEVQSGVVRAQGGDRVVLHGQYRAALLGITQTAPFLRARVAPLPPEAPLTHPQRSLVEDIREGALVIARADGAPPDGLEMLERMREPAGLLDFVAGNVPAPVDMKARWLAAPLGERIPLVLDHIRTLLASARER